MLGIKDILALIKREDKTELKLTELGADLYEKYKEIKEAHPNKTKIDVLNEALLAIGEERVGKSKRENYADHLQEVQELTSQYQVIKSSFSPSGASSMLPRYVRKNDSKGQGLSL